ncbi:MAG: CAP domain-containing protein [Salibacteraceae bacterium]|nr:CAP domain-containing protein [Salibacteraceae bacterium]
MKQRVLGFVILMLAPVFMALGQQANDQIFPDQYNKKYLEHLIKTKVDSVRAVHDLPPLANDSVLYVAAQYHADYLKRTNRFSHFEDDIPKMKTPQLRIDSFGAVNVLAGENLVKSFIQKPLRNKKGGDVFCKTYQQTAWHLVDLWVHSPGHFSNIIRPSWDITGVAITMDTNTGQVIAAQKFGDVLFAYEFAENKAFFNYSDYKPSPPITSFSGIDSNLLVRKHEYGTLPLVWSPNAVGAAAVVEERKYKIDTYTSGKKVGIETYSTEMLYNFLSLHRKNGLAFEFVPFEPYDCGNPAYYTQSSRRNGQRIYSGEITEPLYRKDLIGGFKRNKFEWFWRANQKSERDKFKMILGIQPENSIYYERNILFYYKKQLLRVMHLTGYCGNGTIDFQLEHPSLGFVKYEPENQLFVPPAIDKSIAFEVPFERGKVDFTGENANPILDSIRVRFTRIDSLKINAYSSLEGDSAVNARLQIARSENILNLIASNEPHKTIPFQIALSENWDKMYEQIADSIGAEDWAEWSKTEIKKQLNADPDSFEFLLKEQRKAVVQIDGVFRQNLQDSLDYIREKYEKILVVDKPEILEVLDDTLAKYYAFYAKLVNYEEDKMLALPESLKMVPHLDQTRYWIALLHSIKDWRSQTELGEINAQLQNWKRSSTSMAVYYNCLMFELKLDADSHRIDYIKLYQEAKKRSFGSALIDGVSQSRIDSIWLLLNIRTADQILAKGRNDFQENLNVVFDFYEKDLSKIANESDVVRLANFFLKFDDQPFAHHFLEPWANAEHLEALKLFAKINYHHIEEYPESVYFDWLIKIQEYLPQEDWCSLFIGECNIPFQVFDYEPLKQEYCEKCDEYKNYVERLYETQLLEKD